MLCRESLILSRFRKQQGLLSAYKVCLLTFADDDTDTKGEIIIFLCGHAYHSHCLEAACTQTRNNTVQTTTSNTNWIGLSPSLQSEQVMRALTGNETATPAETSTNHDLGCVICMAPTTDHSKSS